MSMDMRRVRLVFADELARLLLRQRGFASCWYLVPPAAKLVGDLAHEISLEFGLSAARCPFGIDLVLEQLHLVPSHDIRIVRDNDEISVQCASQARLHSSGSSSSAVVAVATDAARALLGGSADDDADGAFSSKQDAGSASDAVVVSRKQRHDKTAAKQAKKVLKAKMKAKRKMKEEALVEVEAAGSRTKVTVKAKAKEAKKKKVEGQQQQKAAAAIRDATVRGAAAAQSSSSDDSDSSSDSDSSDSEAEQPTKVPLAAAPAVAAASKKRKVGASGRAAAAPPVSKSSSSGSSDSSDSSSSSSSDSETEEHIASSARDSQSPRKRQRVQSNAEPSALSSQPRAHSEKRHRRRRRLRNRKPREARASAASERSTIVAPETAALPKAAAASEPAALSQPQPHASDKDVTLNGTAKGHVRFGDAGESHVVVAAPQSSSEVLNIRRPRAFVASPALQKYGPSEAQAAPARDSSRAPRAQREAPRATRSSSHEQQPSQRQQDTRNADHSSRTNASINASKKPKVPLGTMWKRPYEVVASIHDTHEDASNGTADVPALLAAFPAASSPVAADSLAPDDVVAYKTLTLCMETWQPIASDWLCGKVASVGSSGDVQLEPLQLRARTDSTNNGDAALLQWTPVASNDSTAVELQLSEVSELRYLDGPSHHVLRELNQQLQSS